ncbi:hypothetical protein EV426DRAFT_607362 [Tirmania nivea]|nr:hypothetical protein EV426DRAFT_607362 [Tirmania nivea]
MQGREATNLGSWILQFGRINYGRKRMTQLRPSCMVSRSRLFSAGGVVSMSDISSHSGACRLFWLTIRSQMHTEESTLYTQSIAAILMAISLYYELSQFCKGSLTATLRIKMTENTIFLFLVWLFRSALYTLFSSQTFTLSNTLLDGKWGLMRIGTV